MQTPNDMSLFVLFDKIVYVTPNRFHYIKSNVQCCATLCSADFLLLSVPNIICRQITVSIDVRMSKNKLPVLKFESNKVFPVVCIISTNIDSLNHLHN